MSDEFTSPSTATGLDLKVLNGSLLLITVNGVEESVQTTYGPSSAVRADIVVLDGSASGEVHNDTLIFPRVLQSQLKSQVGKSKVLARLMQGVAKPGQSAPWVLSEATENDKATARKYLNYVSSQQVATVGAPANTSTPWDS